MIASESERALRLSGRDVSQARRQNPAYRPARSFSLGYCAFSPGCALPVRGAHSEIPTRKTDAWATHENVEEERNEGFFDFATARPADRAERKAQPLRSE